MLRLRLALRGVVAVGLAAAVDRRLGPAVGVPAVVAMLLAGVVSLNAAFATSGRAPRDAARTLAPLPLLTALGTGLAAAGHGHPGWQQAGYVVVMVGAVVARRIGQRSFAYGMVVFQAYLFVAFSGFPPAAVPAVVLVQAAAAACSVLAACVLVPDRPAATLAAARRAFTARVAALAATAADALVQGEDPERAAARLQARGLRLVEAALLVDGYVAVAAPGRPVPGGDRSAAAVRAGLLHAELAAAELASAVGRLHRDAPADAPSRTLLAGALRSLADGDLLAARARALRLVDRLDHLPGADPPLRALARDAATAAGALVDVLDAAAPTVPDHLGGAAPAPAVALAQGNLPGAATSARDAIAARARAGGRAGRRWAGLSANTRTGVQTAVAGTASLLVAHAISATRWYWALLACFLVLTGTLSTGETVAKGVNRVLGTVAGLVAAVLAVHLTGDRPGGVVAVMVVCGALGLYFFRVTYAVMAFAVTTIMGMLYEVLREFSDALLGLRLLETAVGAAIAVAVSLLVLPVRSGDVRAAAERAFLEELDALLADLRGRLAEPGRSSDLYLDARRLDASLLQLVLVDRPAAGPAMLGLSTRTAARRARGWTEVAYRARALTVAVARSGSGGRPDLARRLDDLRSPRGAPTAPAAAGDRVAPDALDPLLDDLAGAVAALRAGAPAAGGHLDPDAPGAR